MFANTPSFNQPLDEWDTSSMLSMTNMFAGATNFDQDLSSWDFSAIGTAGGWFHNGLSAMFTGVSLSTLNADNVLVSIATQATDNALTNLPLNIGLKTYSSTGAAAITTLEGLGWTVTEQYQAVYSPSADAALIGDNSQTGLDTGDTTTAVTVNPLANCTFVQWSDGRTDNPRTDTMDSDSISVAAELVCSAGSITSTSASTQRDRSRDNGNNENAKLIEDRFLTTSSSTQPLEHTAAVTLEDVQDLPDTIGRILATDSSPETKQAIIAILLKLVEILTALMVTGQVE